ncbi:MFS general substrate transporter [Dentipellis sp. KUC8613]|nr:MFS general substrate transporter [Dentipellis sp. KUC8613]
MASNTGYPAEKQSTEKGVEGEYPMPYESQDTLTPDLYDEGSVDPVYQAKARILNRALQEIGMGKYQWGLFVVSGFGWFSDSVWPLLTGLILSPVINEFQFNGPFLSLASNIGLLVGAVLWSFGCDIWGRRWSFNLTLFLASIFGIAAGGAPNFVGLACLVAILSVGVGGNMPVDSAVFLDFVPGSHQYLLTILSIWWAIGQLLGSLVAWPLIANFSCPQNSTAPCTRADNMGWRYLLFALGGLMLLLSFVRMFLFHLHESPRFLIGRGRDAEAVAVVHAIARYNGVESSLSVEDLLAAGKGAETTRGAEKWRVLSESSSWGAKHVRALFATPKMAWSSSLLIALWGIIGLASTLYNSFLPFLLASRGAKFDDATYYTTYRNQVILSITGIPGAFLAGWAVELPYIGRRGTLAISAGLTGAFLFASTTARSSAALLGWNCGYAFFSNIMYGVLYAISPELFPAKDRGTGNGLVSTATRVFGVVAPVIALYANLETAVPVYIAGALIIGAGALALLLPFEPRGKASI